MNRKTGFTLIELLVVVLIIGILAAVALPIYNRAVEKSKTSQLKILVRNIADAQERYFLGTQTYANDFGSLDLDLKADSNPSKSLLGPTVSSSDAVRRFKDFEIIINNVSNNTISITGSTNTGKYKGGYISYLFMSNTPSIPLKKILCAEDTRTNVFTAPAGDFCIKTAGFKNYITTSGGSRWYTEN